MNLLGIISQFGRLLPGYIQGERMAVQDNWNDLNQYNQVQSGQIQNAYDEAVFNPRVNMLYDQAELSSLGVDTSRMNYDVNRAMQPGRMFQATSFSGLQPLLAPLQGAAQMQQAQTVLDMFRRPKAYSLLYGGFPGIYSNQFSQLSQLMNNNLPSWM